MANVNSGMRPIWQLVLADMVAYSVRMGIYTDHLPAAVAEQLRAERAAKGITYDRLAQLTGMSKFTVMRYLKQERSIPLPEFAALSEALGLAPVEVMRRAMERIPKG